jgi:hypothetical protein
MPLRRRGKTASMRYPASGPEVMIHRSSETPKMASMKRWKRKNKLAARRRNDWNGYITGGRF